MVTNTESLKAKDLGELLGFERDKILTIAIHFGLVQIQELAARDPQKAKELVDVSLLKIGK